ncbi:hypothetical protein AB1K32_05090 [Metabacillus dongyingensis]|uniref:hypothetical protein n=1 Tax=Metabacillus dongyingensis TaxID=2874282 RepID=UPI003B8D6050
MRLACHYGDAEFVKVLLQKGAYAFSHSKLSFLSSNTTLYAAISGKQSPKFNDMHLSRVQMFTQSTATEMLRFRNAAFEGNTEIGSLLIHNEADTLSGEQRSAAEIAKRK